MGDRLPSAPWMPLVTGERLSVLKPEQDKISAEAIAYGLAGQYRFGGQSRPRITVAEHSVLAAEYAERNGHGLRMAVLMLFHDAAEGLGWGDLPRPNKQQCHMFQTLIDRCQLAVWCAMGVYQPDERERLTMRRIDDTMLATEADRIGFSTAGWNLIDRPDPETEIEWWPPEVAEHRFLSAWKDLHNRAIADKAATV